MTRFACCLSIAGLVAAAGCTTEEPQNGTSTAASSVGMSGGSSSDATSTGDASASSGTDASSGGSGGLVVDYETDVQPLWNGSCSCHLMGPSGTMTAPLLTLNPQMSHGELVGVPSEQSTLNRVEAGSTAESYLWLKLTGAHAEGGEGDPMPPTGTLDDEQLDVIEAWILAGALP